MTGADIPCSACGSSTHGRPTHRACPFTAASLISSEGEELGVVSAASSESEGDFFESDLCTCGSSGRTHKRECPLSLRKHYLNKIQTCIYMNMMIIYVRLMVNARSEQLPWLFVCLNSPSFHSF